MDPIDDDEEGDWRRERSPTPVLDSAAEGKAGKSRKRLVKKNARESSPDWEGSPVAAGLDDWEEEPFEKKRKKATSLKEGKGGSGGKDKKRKSSSFKVELSAGKGFKSGSKGYGGGSNDEAGDPEMKELWDTIAGGDSEDDQEGVRTVDDDNFIDDSGVDPADRFGSDNEAGSAGDVPQAEEGEEDDEISKLFKAGKKKKKNERSPAELAMVVEHLMAELEVIAEEDAELNRQNKPAVNKLKKLPLLVDVLSKKKLQQEFLDHGVLTLLKNWLEPLPDGSLPNMNIRTAILKLLTDMNRKLQQLKAPKKRQLQASKLSVEGRGMVKYL